MKLEEVKEFALQGFTPEARELGTALRDAYNDKKSKYAATAVKKKEDTEKKIIFTLKDYYQGFKKIGKTPDVAKERAIKKTAESLQMLEKEIKKFWKASLE
jgi:hypothetical protein